MKHNTDTISSIGEIAKDMKVHVRPGVDFFSWCAALGKILATDNLKKLRIVIMDLCYLCKSHTDSFILTLLRSFISFCLVGMNWVVVGGENELGCCF